jgi:hypothetical protein
MQVELANLVKQRLVADPQRARRIFATPVCLLKGIGDGYPLGFILQAANQRLQALLARRHGLLARRSPLAHCSHLDQFAEAALVVV